MDMSLVRWTPASWDPFQEMEEMMQRLPSMFRQNGMNRGFIPAVDMYETKEAVVVETPLPGIDLKDVQVSVENGVLTIQGETKKEHEVEEKNYYRKETRSGSFYRQVGLPVGVKEEEIKAEFTDGVLKVTCPKAMPSEGKKINIEIAKK